MPARITTVVQMQNVSLRVIPLPVSVGQDTLGMVIHAQVSQRLKVFKISLKRGNLRVIDTVLHALMNIFIDILKRVSAAQGS